MQNHLHDRHSKFDFESPYRHQLHDSCARISSAYSRLIEAKPERTMFAAGLFGLIGVGAAAITASGAFNSCTTQPVALRLGENAIAEMTVAKGSRCSLRVETGSARIDDLVVESYSSRGDIFARGRTGVIYQPSARFTGEDSFVFALHGRTARGWSKMTVRVSVAVK
jgi:hypothetical protein